MENMTYIAALSIAVETMKAANVDAEAVGKVENLLGQYQARKASPRKKSKRVVAENDSIKERIRECLNGVEYASAKEIAEAVGISVQKTAAMLHEMEDVKVNRDGKVALFSLYDFETAEDETEDGEGA